MLIVSVCFAFVHCFTPSDTSAIVQRVDEKNVDFMTLTAIYSRFCELYASKAVDICNQETCHHVMQVKGTASVK